MSKYSYEFKLEVVKYYLENNYGYKNTAKHFKVAATPVLKWIKRYEMHGDSGLIKSQIKSYNGDFKKNVIEYMHGNHLSATETANYFKLAGADVVLRWEHIYYEEGPQGLYIERRGRTRKMSSKSNNKKLDKKDEKDLLAEVEQLRMENEYLKKLNTLVQERIKRENKKK